MDAALSLLECPRCGAALAEPSACGACGSTFARGPGFVDFIEREARPAEAREVTRFYERFPFPGYAPSDDATTLLERSRRSSFLVALDRAIPPDARVLDCGCGTGQLASFLGLAGPRRLVMGVDACPASLGAAAEFKERASIENLRLYLGDLFHLPIRADEFDVVISRGVVHHTPDPSGATREVARRVRPGGVLVLGFYENVARLPHRLRRVLARVRGEPVRMLDPILRRRDLSEEKKQIWIEDQYRHPLERMLPLPGVVGEVEALGFDWVRTYPPTLDPGSDPASLFEPTARPGASGLFLRRAGWALAGIADADAGLVSVIFRRRAAP